MGVIIDLDNEGSDRCDHVKLGIILINLIGAPLSFILLLIGILRMISSNKTISFLTSLVILIFSSEIVNAISKMIQLIKYCFEDTRSDIYDNNHMDNPRSIICQIQIVLAIFSDYCSLLANLFLSKKCYDVIKNKIGFFDKRKNIIYPITVSILLSIILAIALLFIDRIHKSNRFDIRDRCSYWCWLDLIPSIFCYVVYLVILFFNIFFAFKTISCLKERYKKIFKENSISDVENRLSENSKENCSQYSDFTEEEKKELKN